MARDRTIRAILRAEVGQFVKGMKDASAATEQTAQKTERTGSAIDRLSANVKKNEQAYRTAGGALVAFGAGVTALSAIVLKTGISYNSLQQTSRSALKTLLGGAKAANAQMDKLDEFARTSPFAKQVFIKAQQQLLGFGIEAGKVVPILSAVQDAVAAIGGSNEDISGIVDTLAKVKGQGKITAETLNELGIRGVDAATIIGDQMGKTGAQIRDEITKGTLGADDALDALTAGLEDKFGGAAQDRIHTFAGALDNASAAFRDFAADVTKPLVNPDGGGILVDALNSAADLTRAFSALPGPVKTAAAALTGFVGVGSLVGGGLLLLAPRIVETRSAIKTLGRAMPRTRSYAGLLANTLKGPLLVGLGLVAAATYVWTKRSSLAAASQAKIKAAASSVADTLDKSTGAITSQTRELIANQLAQDGVFEVAKKYGISLGLVTDAALGSADAQAKLNDQIAGLGDIGFDDALKLAGGYETAAESARLGKEQFKDTGDAIGKAGDQSSAAADKVKELQDSASKTADSFRDYSDSIAGGEFTLKSYLKALEGQADALSSFASNLRTAAKRGLDDGLIASLRNAGPAGAQALAALANASDKEIARANAAFRRGENGANDLTDAVVHIPGQKRIRIDVNTGQALNDIRGFQQKINDLHGKTIGIHISSTVGGGTTLRASGGYVSGPGSSTSDSIPARLSNGEYVVNARQTGRFLPLLEAINAGKYRDGGRVNAQKFAAGGSVRPQPLGPAPVARGGDGGSQTLTASLVGARVELDGDGFARFVDGRVEVGIAANTLAEQTGLAYR